MGFRILDQMDIPIGVRTSEEFVELKVSNRIHELTPSDASNLAKELMRASMTVAKTAPTDPPTNGDAAEETEEEEEEEEDGEEDEGEETP